VKVTFSVTGMRELREELAAFSDRRFGSVVAKAINDTAFEVRDGLRVEMQRVFDRPVPWTLNSLAVKRADIGDLAAEISFKPSTGGRLSAGTYLQPEVRGGARRQKAFEKLLVKAGYLPAGSFAVPGAGVRLDQHGNIPRALLGEILSHLRAHGATREKRNLSTARRLRNAQKRTGGRYFAITERGKGLAPGIWRRSLSGRDPVPMLLFVRPPSYRSRLDFDGVAQRIVRSRLQHHFDRAVAASAARLAARG
jgi:hypothetical protein